MKANEDLIRSSDVSLSSTQYDDEYSVEAGGRSRGEIRIEGFAKLYLGKLPKDFSTNNPRTLARRFKSTEWCPGFWEDAVGTPHHLVCQWNTIDPTGPGANVKFQITLDTRGWVEKYREEPSTGKVTTVA